MAEKLKKKINGHLGHFTKELDSWQKLMELATAIKSDRSIADMRKKQEKCEGILDTIRALTLEVNDIDPENVRNDELLNDYQGRYDSAFALYMAAEKAVALPVAQPPAALATPRSRAVRPKNGDPMKPNDLAPEAKPSELRAWKKRFTTYYTSHYMEDMPLAEQHIHIFHA